MDETKDKLKVHSNHNETKFMIVWHNPETDEDKFFGGYYNDIEELGTENECQCWEQEDWVDDADIAFGWDSFVEAVEIYNLLDKKMAENSSIILYGKSFSPNFEGSHWYPLKVFLSGKPREELL